MSSLNSADTLFTSDDPFPEARIDPDAPLAEDDPLIQIVLCEGFHEGLSRNFEDVQPKNNDFIDDFQSAPGHLLAALFQAISPQRRVAPKQLTLRLTDSVLRCRRCQIPNQVSIATSGKRYSLELEPEP